MTIDPGGGAEWMVDLEGWGSNLYVAGCGLHCLACPDDDSPARISKLWAPIHFLKNNSDD